MGDRADDHEDRLVFYERIKLVASLVAALWIGIEYYGGVLQKKEDRTLQFAERYLTGDVLLSHKDLDALFMSPETIEFAKKHTRRSVYERTIAIADDYYKKDYIDVVTMADFFNDLSKCVDTDGCDANLACQFFANRVDNFTLHYLPKIYSWEKQGLTDKRADSIKKFKYVCVDSGYLESDE
jgi:hypothetical protein